MANSSVDWLWYPCNGGFYGAIGRIKYLKKIRNYSRFPLTNADNYIIMANMTNNNNNVLSERLIMKFQVLRTIVRNGEWVAEKVAEFATEAEANACAKRCHNGNPTTRVVKR